MHSTDPFQNSRDGAGPQAVATLAMFSYFASGVSASYVGGSNYHYEAEPRTDRWMNGREQGYVISMTVPSHNHPQINIAFFEHRNSDDIHALVFESKTIYGTAPTLGDIPTDHPYLHDKYATQHKVNPGQFMEMAEWIIDKLNEFWKDNVQTKDEDESQK